MTCEATTDTSKLLQSRKLLSTRVTTKTGKTTTSPWSSWRIRSSTTTAPYLSAFRPKTCLRARSAIFQAGEPSTREAPGQRFYTRRRYRWSIKTLAKTCTAVTEWPSHRACAVLVTPPGALIRVKGIAGDRLCARWAAGGIWWELWAGVLDVHVWASMGFTLILWIWRVGF